MEQYTFRLPQRSVSAKPAPLLRRLLAYAIDFAIFYFILFPPFIMAYSSLRGIPSEMLDNLVLSRGMEAMKIIALQFTSLTIFLFYFTITEAEFGASPGKILLGMQVQNAGYASSILRSLTKTVLLPLLPIDMLGLLLKKNQRITELLSGTKVIYSKKLSLEFKVE